MARLIYELKNRQFSVGRLINTPAREVWQVLTDTSLWPEWGPSVTGVNCSSRFIFDNSQGRIKTRLGLWVPFQITSFKTEREWAWAVGGINATGHRIVPVKADSCILFFDMPIWAVPYSMICWLALRRIERIAMRHKRNETRKAPNS